MKNLLVLDFGKAPIFNGLVFISIGKEISINGVTKNTFFSLQLVELSMDQMIFASGEKGNYQKAIVFLAI